MSDSLIYNEEIVYHGSNTEVSSPKILVNGYHKDFGYGFYCTKIKKQAVRWALTRKGCSYVNSYVYSLQDLRCLIFDEMDDEWLDFVVACRRGMLHNYDVVEGPMADDQIWDYVEDFVAGNISVAAFWELVKFKHPTHQIAFCTEKALTQIKFKGSESI